MIAYISPLWGFFLEEMSFVQLAAAVLAGD